MRVSSTAIDTAGESQICTLCAPGSKEGPEDTVLASGKPSVHREAQKSQHGRNTVVGGATDAGQAQRRESRGSQELILHTRFTELRTKREGLELSKR